MLIELPCLPVNRVDQHSTSYYDVRRLSNSRKCIFQEPLSQPSTFIVLIEASRMEAEPAIAAAGDCGPVNVRCSERAL